MRLRPSPPRPAALEALTEELLARESLTGEELAEVLEGAGGKGLGGLVGCPGACR